MVEQLVSAARRGVPALELLERANGRCDVLRAAQSVLAAAADGGAAERLERALQWRQPIRHAAEL